MAESKEERRRRKWGPAPVPDAAPMPAPADAAPVPAPLPAGVRTQAALEMARSVASSLIVSHNPTQSQAALQITNQSTAPTNQNTMEFEINDSMVSDDVLDIYIVSPLDKEITKFSVFRNRFRNNAIHSFVRYA